MHDTISGLIDEYIAYVAPNLEQHIKAEKYKLNVLRHFQNTFDIDATDFYSNLRETLSKLENLAVGAGYYPVTSVLDIAKKEPELVREAFRILFSNDLPELERFSRFQEIMSPLSQKYSFKTVSFPYNMDLRFMSLLLSLRYPYEWMYFKPKQVDIVYKKLTGEKTGSQALDANRILKARDFGKQILYELQNRTEFLQISEAMGYPNEPILWFAQDVIWFIATNENDSNLLQKVKDYIASNPDWRNNKAWRLVQGDVDAAIDEFRNTFAPAKLQQMSDEEVLRSMPYREVSTNDSLSYALEFDPIISGLGGIGGGSAGKMGYYQGKDGNWKTISNKITTKEDVLHHRRMDIEVLSNMYDLIASDNFDGLKSYIDTLRNKALDTDDAYKALVPGLVWVRKYFTVLFPNKFIMLYGNGYVKKLEKIADIGLINGDGKDWDYALWYQQTYKISSIAREVNISNYELSMILWNLINDNNEQEVGRMENDNKDSQQLIGLNTILYGPPGTGKTYQALKVYAKNLLSHQAAKGRSRLEVLADQIKDLTWWQVTALCLYHENRYMKVSELANTELILSYSKFVKNRTTSVVPTLWATLQERSDELSSKSSYRISDVEYFNKNSASEWGLSDEGKAYVHEALADIRIDAQAEENSDWSKFYRTITFHQSYSYEEFVEGIRPVVDADAQDGGLQFTIKDGIFKEMCAIATRDPENNYMLIIDEINRGNISKIFGELITLLEADKRADGENAIYIQLPYSKELFSVPSNLYVFGTMNTADRSIALLDVALRRRFDFIEIMPNISMVPSDVEGVNLQLLLASINSSVIKKIDRNHQIGHSYLMGITSLAELRKKWYQRILPLLQEYFYDDADELRSVLKTFIENYEIVHFEGEAFRDALIDIYEQAHSTDSRI